MKKSNLGKNLIAKWVNGDLTPFEKEIFEKTSEFKQYQKLLYKVEELSIPVFEKEKIEKNILVRIDQNKSFNSKSEEDSREIHIFDQKKSYIPSKNNSSNSDRNEISKWINNDLDTEEKEIFENSFEFSQYKKILDKVEGLTPPAFDLKKSEDLLFNKIDNIDNVEEKSENLISKWINKDLSEHEKEAFEVSEAFSQYQKILSKVDQLTVATFDKDKAEKDLFNKIDTKEVKSTSSEKKRVKVISMKTVSAFMAIAAVVVIGMFIFTGVSSTVYESGYGEQLTVKLPDGSEAILNAKSKIIFDTKSWGKSKNRMLSLSGEAYFKVKKGSDFIVNTDYGDVTVVGTEFNVKSGKKFLEVICHEGKVKVRSTDKSPIYLTKGKAYRNLNNKESNWNVKVGQLGWLIGETVCYDLPLKKVLKMLENQFNVVFVNTNVDVNQSYSGTYTNDDLSLALKTVLIPMDIRYKVKKENIIEISEN